MQGNLGLFPSTILDSKPLLKPSGPLVSVEGTSRPMSLGRVTAALATVHNENSASLANLNFDFTLVKLEAPAEYNGLGATISRKRKDDAEDGALHRTARKLGALFEGLLPPTEDLFRAYGRRVSEISFMPDINPREGLERGGIFAGHVGADTASIWAAVTSGSSAIAAHLLGCLLARIFTGPEAVSVWVEIVQKHKERIRDKQTKSLYSHEQLSEFLAAQSEITRGDLANWDASARAWLQSADQAKQLQHKQMMLILNNASVPVNNEPETYASVIKAWTVALEAMNNLVRGIPQRVQDGAALLAISSWHLYPDMVVYAGPGVEVKQNDAIFEPAALLTLGLQHIRDNNKSVYWSLPLAHLQFYGHPIRASRTTGQENSRVSYQQFAYIILGCLFVGWKDLASTNKKGLLWVQRIGRILKLPAAKDFDNDAEKDQNPAWLLYSKNVEERLPRRNPSSVEQPCWLNYLLSAAIQLNDCGEQERKAANQLMNLGRRRSSFLHSNSEAPSPLFSLSQVAVLLSVLKSDLQRVQLLRIICDQLKLDGSQFLILYISSTRERRTEYASLGLVPCHLTKRMHNGNLKSSQLSGSEHIRWITLSFIQLTICVRRSKEFYNVEKAIETLRELEDFDHMDLYARRKEDAHGLGLGQDQDITPARQKRLDEIRELKEVIMAARRVKSIEQIGEVCLPVAERVMGTQDGILAKGLIFSLESDFIAAAEDISEKLLAALEMQASFITSKEFYAGDVKYCSTVLYCTISGGSSPQLCTRETGTGSKAF